MMARSPAGRFRGVATPQDGRAGLGRVREVARRSTRRAREGLGGSPRAPSAVGNRRRSWRSGRCRPGPPRTSRARGVLETRPPLASASDTPRPAIASRGASARAKTGTVAPGDRVARVAQNREGQGVRLGDRLRPIRRLGRDRDEGRAQPFDLRKGFPVGPELDVAVGGTTPPGRRPPRRGPFAKSSASETGSPFRVGKPEVGRVVAHPQALVAIRAAHPLGVARERLESSRRAPCPAGPPPGRGGRLARRGGGGHVAFYARARGPGPGRGRKRRPDGEGAVSPNDVRPERRRAFGFRAILNA